jgi:peptidoglycan hydrolase-like protein with peptidoglycan-binding domain
MDTFAYSHLALEHEAATNEELTVANPFEDLNWNKASSGWVRVLAVLVFFSIIGAANSAVAGHYHKGSRGPKVASIQYVLKQKGYFHAKITGYYGPITQKAVMAFQRDRGLSVDGVVGPKTKYAMTHYKKAKQQEPKPKYHKVSHSKMATCRSCSKHGMIAHGDRGYEVKKVQRRLARMGYFHAKATGYYGPITKHAVMAFQRKCGLKADGVVGHSTRKAMGI